MKYTKLFLFIIFLTILSSCEEGNVSYTLIEIYKMKDNYSYYVPIGLSPDGKEIFSVPGGTLEPPTSLINGYWLNSTMGVNTAYVDIPIEDWNKMTIIPSNDSLYNIIIEKDPYTEYYIRDDDNLKFLNNEPPNGLDTALMNQLIRTNRLEDYFKRLK